MNLLRMATLVLIDTIDIIAHCTHIAICMIYCQSVLIDLSPPLLHGFMQPFITQDNSKYAIKLCKPATRQLWSILIYFKHIFNII